MAKPKIPLAIAYDFDGTLAPGNMQEHSYIPELGMSKSEFWTAVKEEAKQNDMDEILAYMSVMLREAQRLRYTFNRRTFEEHGRKLDLFPGVEEWFPRINAYGKERGVRVDHYIISSGLREMIQATRIGRFFKYIFASGYHYDQHDVAQWPAVAVNYTSKTQFLFRINKGIDNCWDNELINKYIEPEKRKVPFSNMLYLGDGETDVPAMKMIKYQGGYAIAVYDPKKKKTSKRPSSKETCLELLRRNRADFIAQSDYSEGKQLDTLVKGIIDIVATQCLIAAFKK